MDRPVIHSLVAKLPNIQPRKMEEGPGVCCQVGGKHGKPNDQKRGSWLKNRTDQLRLAAGPLEHLPLQKRGTRAACRRWRLAQGQRKTRENDCEDQRVGARGAGSQFDDDVLAQIWRCAVGVCVLGDNGRGGHEEVQLPGRRYDGAE
jgi:hypothetical protein